MIGFIIILVLAVIGSVVYLALRGGAKAAHVELDRDNGPEVPETTAAAEHRARVRHERPSDRP